MTIILSFFSYLIFVNLRTYRLFAVDKQAAINKEKRTPESTLLFWARIGGWGGAKYAQRRLPHKNHKQPFGSQLNAIGVKHGIFFAAVACTFGFLGFAQNAQHADAKPRTAQIAGQDTQPAGAPPVISLRPPAARPAGW